MRIGIPAEVKNHEYRVAITPAGVRELVLNGHEIFVQAGAGTGSSITDAEYQAAGAQVLRTADDVWGTGDLILKVKEPIAEEYGRMRAGQVLFTYLHLAASKACTDALLSSGITSIAYETVQLPDGSLPLLAPMSEVAGRMAPQVGAHHLQRDGGGRGVLMGGVSGVYAAKVVVLGAGVSGRRSGPGSEIVAPTSTHVSIVMDCACDPVMDFLRDSLHAARANDDLTFGMSRHYRQPSNEVERNTGQVPP